MRRLSSLLVGLALMVVPASAAVTAKDGVYRTTFSGGQCGVLTVKGGAMKYAYGPCGGAATFKASGRLNGDTIKIMKATFKVRAWTSSQIKGQWTLGKYSRAHTFSRQ